jgi:methionine synthase II (cobalamin-independent)
MTTRDTPPFRADHVGSLLRPPKLQPVGDDRVHSRRATGPRPDHAGRDDFGEDFASLRSVAGGLTPKLTIPSPSMVHYRGGPASIDPTLLIA